MVDITNPTTTPDPNIKPPDPSIKPPDPTTTPDPTVQVPTKEPEAILPGEKQPKPATTPPTGDLPVLPVEEKKTL